MEDKQTWHTLCTSTRAIRKAHGSLCGHTQVDTNTLVDTAIHKDHWYIGIKSNTHSKTGEHKVLYRTSQIFFFFLPGIAV